MNVVPNFAGNLAARLEVASIRGCVAVDCSTDVENGSVGMDISIRLTLGSVIESIGGLAWVAGIEAIDDSRRTGNTYVLIAHQPPCVSTDRSYDDFD